MQLLGVDYPKFLAREQLSQITLKNSSKIFMADTHFY